MTQYVCFSIFTQIALKIEKPLEVNKKFVPVRRNFDWHTWNFNVSSVFGDTSLESPRWKNTYSFYGIRKLWMIMEESSIRERRMYLNVLYDCISLGILSYLLNYVNYVSYTWSSPLYWHCCFSFTLAFAFEDISTSKIF